MNKLPLTSILGVPDRDKYFTLNDLGNFTSPEPEIKEIYFQLSEPKVYYYSYIPDDYQVVIDRVIVTADGQFDGIRDGDCTCTHKVWNGTNWTTETVTCPNFKRPSSVDGSGENDNSFKIRVAKSNGGTEFHRYKKIYAIGYHNFDNNDDSMEIRADGGSWIQLNTSWGGKYDLGVTNGNLGSYVFARYSSGLLDDVGCNDTVGAYRWTAELVKYYVGVPQIYHVKAVMEFDMNLSVYGNLYAIDDNLIKDIIIKALKLDTLNPDSPDIKKALEQSIKLRYERGGGSWQDFGLITYQNDTVGLFFTDDTTADVYKDHYYDYTFIVPPSLVFIPKLYQYIPFNLTIKNIHVTIVYEFDAGYPGRVKDGIPPYERERGGKEYNWFDVTSLITLDEHKQIMNADDPDKEAKKIIWNFVKHFDDQFSQGGKAKLYILVNPTRDGGNYFPYDLQGYVEFIKISQVFKKT
ncbi:hypothetical protein [Thermococcus sp. JCM 11816]|uniref:hypothetical protein n=1 Tax=Thermococcus sp. (strain JCM 11816 / KS-1) TaxID=1295125 RepID=UPI0006CF65C3